MAKTILLVDDSAMMRKIVQKNIKELGLDVQIVEAGDGNQGLEKFKAGGVDLVISDWNMPNMDGLTMVKEIRKLDPEKKVPVMMLTSEATAAKVKEAIAAGANNYLSKPFTPENLSAKLGTMLS